MYKLLDRTYGTNTSRVIHRLLKCCLRQPLCLCEEIRWDLLVLLATLFAYPYGVKRGWVHASTCHLDDEVLVFALFVHRMKAAGVSSTVESSTSAQAR